MRILLLLLAVVPIATAANSVGVCKLRFAQPEVTMEYVVEIARSGAEREQGLMGRTALDPGHGMLFDFGTNSHVTMWMKNTLLSLDMIFIGASGEVASIHRGTIPLSEKLVSSEGRIRYVLEVAAGDSARLKIGARLDLERLYDCVKNLGLMSRVSGEWCLPR